MPPPSESDILANYLLQPAPLPSIITFEQFVLLFPRPMHNSPQLRSLYRDLQAQRNSVVDAVSASIQEEVKRGSIMRMEVLRLRREAEGTDVDGEVELERALFGYDSGLKLATHTLNSVIPEVEGAVDALAAEVQSLGEEEATLQGLIQQTIGGLSDLRYGKLANSKLREEVVDGLKSLQEVCENKS